MRDPMTDIISQLVNQIESEEIAKEQAALDVNWAHLENLILNPAGWWIERLAQAVWKNGGDEGRMDLALPLDFWSEANTERRERLCKHIQEKTNGAGYVTRQGSIYWNRNLLNQGDTVD